eukprot:m.19010 g.19010  ORF g.19010 m.19010 type:complete len:408 (-) comp6466_c0_seq1:793-2016(-)
MGKKKGQLTKKSSTESGLNQRRPSGGEKANYTDASISNNNNNNINNSITNDNNINDNINDGKKSKPDGLDVEPVSSGFLFEIFLFLLATCHLLIQCYNLNHWNLHLYNVPHIAFTAVLFTKRIAWKFVYPSLEQLTVGSLLRLLLMVVPLLSLLKSVASLFTLHDASTFLYLFYPSLFHFSLFGVTWKRPIWTQNISNSSPPVRNATILLKFRHDLKEILYGSLEVGYYAGWLPMQFLLNRYAIFDSKFCHLLILYVVLNTASLLITNWLTASWSLNKLANVLGCWSSVSGPKAAGFPMWSAHQKWTKGQRVNYKKKAYVGEAAQNAAEPGDWLAWTFYRSFRKPNNVATGAVVFQSTVCLSQLLFLVQAIQRDDIINWTIMLGFSYANLVYLLYVRRKLVATMGIT